jgi:hypothetical protein
MPRGGAGPASPWAMARRLAADARRRLPVLWFAGWCALAISFVLLALAGLDGRTFNGVSVWTKPWKFHLSTGVHLLTLAWCAAMLPDTPARDRAFGRMSAVALACSLFELAYITWRASRGEASHFNLGSPFAGTMYTLMGIGAVMLTACAGWLGWHIGRARDFAFGPVLQRGLALGLMLGFALGTIAGLYLGGQAGHWVGGTPSDAQGLALVGWSRDGGDLRVAHFFGLHAIQALPLAAWLAARRAAPARALRGLNVFAAAYTLLTLFTFVRAVMGRPFI